MRSSIFMHPITEAYKKIFGHEPENLKDWEIAEKVVNSFNVPLMGEELAKKVIFDVVNHTSFPNHEKTTEVVGRAERFATELFKEFEGIDQPHMDEIAHLERKNEFKVR